MALLEFSPTFLQGFSDKPYHQEDYQDFAQGQEPFPFPSDWLGGFRLGNIHKQEKMDKIKQNLQRPLPCRNLKLPRWGEQHSHILI